MIKKPYKNALNLELDLELLFEKNETVRGIIGNTQGVKSAKRPPINPSIIKLKYEFDENEFDESFTVDKSSLSLNSTYNGLVSLKTKEVKSSLSISNFDPSILKTRSASLKIQTISSQAWYAIFTLIVSIFFSNKISWVKVDFDSK